MPNVKCKACTHCVNNIDDTRSGPLVLIIIIVAKVDLADLFKNGMQTREKRLHDKLERESESNDVSDMDFDSLFASWGGDDTTGGIGGWGGPQKKDAYTLTMDFKVIGAIPPNGLSLYQTALCHPSGKGGGKGAVRETDGECKISADGGVGNFGTFGDTSQNKVEPNQWNRIVITVSAVGDGSDNKVSACVHLRI